MSLDCGVLPTGSFVTVWQSDPQLQITLGCPVSWHPRVTPYAWEIKTAYQPFERGEMIWSDHVGWYDQRVIYVLYQDSSYQRFDDTFDGTVDPVGGDETPPDGLVEPILGFGKVWRDHPGVRDALGWATAKEIGGAERWQMFVGGTMIWIGQTDQTYVFASGTGVRVFDIPFSE